MHRSSSPVLLLACSFVVVGFHAKHFATVSLTSTHHGSCSYPLLYIFHKCTLHLELHLVGLVTSPQAEGGVEVAQEVRCLLNSL